MTSQAGSRYDFAEYAQEEFTEDSINIHSVLTWRSTASQALTVDFKNSFYFDSETCPQKHRHLVAAAIETLRSIA